MGNTICSAVENAVKERPDEAAKPVIHNEKHNKCQNKKPEQVQEDIQ